MGELNTRKLMLDSILNMVLAVDQLDLLEAIKNTPGRFSAVAFVAGSVPGGQRATVQGGPGAFTLAHWDAWGAPGGPRR